MNARSPTTAARMLRNATGFSMPSQRVCLAATRSAKLYVDGSVFNSQYAMRESYDKNLAMLHEKRRLQPPPLDHASDEIASFIETYFNAYNAARLRESCQLFARMIDAGATIGVSISGALTPAGLSSVLTPLMQKGFIDYVSSTGANLYHDLHFDLGLPLYRGTADVVTGAVDVQLRKDGI